MKHKTKLQIKAAQIKQQLSHLIDQKYDLIKISQVMNMDIYKVLYYCALIKKAPILGDIDLNYYLNGKYEYQKKRKEEIKKKEEEKPFRPDDYWFNNL